MTSPWGDAILTLQAWLGDLMDELGWQDRHGAYHALRVVLHALRDGLPADDAIRFGSELPLLVRGLYYERWRPGRAPRVEGRDALLAPLAAAFRGEEAVDPERLARAVLRVLRHRLPERTLAGVSRALPEAIRGLWTDAA